MNLFEIEFDIKEQKNCIVTSYETIKQCKNFIKEELKRKNNGIFADYIEIRIVDENAKVIKTYK